MRSRKKFRLILASQSPRRRDILRSAGFDCTTFPSNSSESFSENLTLEENLCQVSERKVEAALERLNTRKAKGSLILGADTIVVAGKKVLGKPKNSHDAARMLRLLSGKTHRVMTAFTIFCPDESRGVTHVVTTRVKFRKLSSDDIQWYVDTNEPFDKAGSYAIQGLAAQFVVQVDGDLQNVIGLPLSAVREEFRKQHWEIQRASSGKASKSSRAHRRR